MDREDCLSRFCLLSSGPDSGKVNVSAFDIRADEFHAHAVSDIEAVCAFRQFSFDRWFKEPHPGGCVGCAGHNRVELLADVRLQQQRRGGLSELPFHSLRIIFLFRAMAGEVFPFVGPVWRRRAFERCFEQPLGDEVWITPVGRVEWVYPFTARPKCSGAPSFDGSSTYSPRPMSWTIARERFGNLNGSALRRVTRKASSACASGSAGNGSPQRVATSTIRCQRSGERRMRRNEGMRLLLR